jgi:glucose-6-phosphate 1-dehydrogenase
MSSRAAPPRSRSEEPPTIRERRLANSGRRRRRARPVLNPLREGLRLERVPDPHLFVLFGATGDLAGRKVFPALYQLWRTNLLPHDWSAIGVARRPYDDDAFRAGVRAALEAHSRVPVEEAMAAAFLERITYQQADFSSDSDFDRLAERLEALDASAESRGNRVYYLATHSSAFPLVVAVFREAQVYRIDHYLGKETVRNLLVFRFANGIFEPIWNRRYVDHVQITVAETIGIEGRGAFYEETGAARDFLQNHLLQLTSLIAMEPPATFDPDALRDEKVKVIRAIQDMPGSDVVRGQYGPGWADAEPVPGYRQEADVDPLSETETFIAARLRIDNWRWSGVPFYLRTGKRLPRRATEVAIQFREVPHRLFREANVDPEPNLLAIRIQPDEGILLRFGSKVPGLGLDIRTVTMDFTYGSAFTTDSPDAYETLILDVMLGDASLFTRADEVEAAWSIVTPIIDSWAEGAAPDFPDYAAGSWGPPDADALIERDGRRWRRL